MGYIELAPSDREKYGAPERIDFEYNQIGLRALAALKKQTGFTLATLAEGLGEDYEDALAAVVWVVLWNNGIKVPWDEFDIVPIGLVVDFKSVDDEGKDQTPQSQKDSGDLTGLPQET